MKGRFDVLSSGGWTDLGSVVTRMDYQIDQRWLIQGGKIRRVSTRRPKIERERRCENLEEV
jgi:hypothetical protein